MSGPTVIGRAMLRQESLAAVVVFNWELLRFTSKLLANVALSSGEAELNSAVKGISEAIGLRELLREILQVTVTIRIHVDASACKGMLLRHGTGKVKRLTTKQLWVQGAVQAYGMEVLNVPRAENSADILTHPTTGEEMAAGLDLMGVRRELAVGPASGRKSPH